MYPTIELSTFQMRKYQFIPTLKKGANGKVFRYNPEMAIKIWCHDEDFFTNQAKQLMFKYCTIATPQILASYNQKIVGYLMDWAVGKKIFCLNDADYYNFVGALRRTYNDIKDISKKSIKLIDCDIKNILYTENKYIGKLTIVDTDLWQLSDWDYKKLLEYNQMELNNAILRSLICLNSLAIHSFTYQNNIENIWNALDLASYLDNLKDIAENYTNKKVRKLSDLERFLR